MPQKGHFLSEVLKDVRKVGVVGVEGSLLGVVVPVLVVGAGVSLPFVVVPQAFVEVLGVED